jgi:hypothetical protein
MSAQKASPEARFQAGSVTASVFLNEARRADQTTFTTRKTVVQKTYVDGEGKYQSTASLDVNDLPRAILVLSQAFAYCSSRNTRRDDHSQEHE